MRLAIKNTEFALRNSTTRIPFRYGKSCLTSCPQSILSVTIETDRGCARGYSGDCLPPGWFDKSPDKDFRQQIDEMLQAIGAAQDVFRDVFRKSIPFFDGWVDAQANVMERTFQAGFPELVGAFANSLVERAVVDASARAMDASFANLIRHNTLELDAGRFHPELAGRPPATWIPDEPLDSVWVRHTVGLADPLTCGELGPDARLDDGYPQTLEEYLSRLGVRYLKIKLSNQLEPDLERLRVIASLVERHCGKKYFVTLDGNEQYQSLEQLDELVQAIRTDGVLSTLWDQTLLFEQPFERALALDPNCVTGLESVSGGKPVIIDESDGGMQSFRQALAVGYRGVSSKNCKGPLKSLFNAGLVAHHNQGKPEAPCVMTGEDLCSVGIVPVQADLCLAATLGIRHVERNGHHYHPGLSYLPESQQRQALAAHGDLYIEHAKVIRPHVVEGRFRIHSLQCVGFGFDVEPDIESMTPANQWKFSSLALD